MATRGTVEHSLTKPAYSSVEYTPEMLREFRNCMDPITGPKYFMKNFMKIQHPTQGGMTFNPYDFQEDLIDTYHNFRYSIAMVSRQMGKSTVAGGYLLWYAMFVPDSTILIAAHKASGASEIMLRIRYAYESCPDHIRAGVTEYNKGSITFDNGSRIVSTTTTENTGRGMSLTLIYLDEFAFVPPRIAKEFWTSLSPTLSTGGKCIITSTPNNDEDTFANIWKGANHTFDQYGNPTQVGVNGFRGYKAIWDRHPDRDDTWADEERSRIGEERFLREHCCEFVIYSETLVDSLHLASMKGSDPEFKTGQMRWYKKPNKNCTYFVSLDPAKGTGGDNAAIQVVEMPSMTQVAEWCHNKTNVEGQMYNLLSVLNYLKEFGVENIYWSVENNGIGEAAFVVIRDTGEENFPGVLINEPRGTRPGKRAIKGLYTGQRSKLDACLQLKRYVENGQMKVHSAMLISELKNFVSSGNTFKALPGEHDDLVMSMLMCVRMIISVSKYDDSIQDVINNRLDVDSLDSGDEDEYGKPMPVGFL